MSSLVTSAVPSKLFKDDYQNWLAVGHAFCLMNEGIRPYMTRSMNTFYKTLLALPHCVCIYDKSRKKNQWHDMTICAWAKALQGHHQGNKPKWNQSDSSKWTDPNLGCWEIAKLFMSGLGNHTSSVIDAESTDVTGLMNILCWCKHFNILRPFAEQVRNARNTKWAHTADLEISLVDKKSVIQSVEDLLTAGALNSDPDARNALQQIKNINNHFDAQKVLLDFNYTCLIKVKETENELADLKMRLSQCEGGSSKDRKEIETLEKKLLSYVNMQKKTIQRMQQCEANQRSETYWFLSLLFMVILVMPVFVKSVRRHSKSCLLAVILIACAVQLDPNVYDDSCPKEDRYLRFDIKEFNFSRQLNTARQGFVGRQWLFKDVKSKLKNPATSTVLIVGDPGSGKSAAVAHLICSRNSEYSINPNIIAYHLCQYYNRETQEPGRFIRNLVDMIARRIPEYENIIVSKSLTERLRRHDCEGHPHECFEEAIIMPLKDVQKTKQTYHHDHDIYYIVLDALDECIPAQGRPVTTIVNLIKDKAPRLPQAIKIIATTRNDSSVIKDLQPFAEVVSIDPFDVRNEEDIAFYIDSVAPNRRSYFIDEVIKYFNFRSNELRTTESQKLVTMGNFLFVKLLLEQYPRIDHESNNVNATPKTLGEVYEEYFRRLYATRESFKQIRVVLEILVSTLQPFKVEDIFSILSLQSKGLDYKYFHQDFNTLSHFLRYGENNTVSLFHRSLVEWLTAEDNKGDFCIQKKEGHKKLIRYYIDLIKNGNGNGTDMTTSVFYLAQHVAYGDIYQEHVELFHNICSAIISRSKSNYNNNNIFLHLAATIENPLVIKLFLPYFQDSNVDCIDDRGYTAAFVSASRGLLENVKLLMNHGANVDHKTNPPPPLPFRSFEDPVVISKREFWSSTMLHAAAQRGYLDIVKFLLQKNASISEKNGVGMTALQLAAENGHLKIVQLLCSNGAVADQLALHHSAMNGHKDVLEFLLKKGVTDECMRCDGSFYWLGGNERYQSLWIDIGLEQPSNVLHNYAFDILQNLTPDKNAQYLLFDDKSLLYCETALHVSVARKHLDVVRVLLAQNGSSVTCTDFTGRSPLHLAAAENNLEIMNLLIDAGARTNPKCSFIQQLNFTVDTDSTYHFKKYKYLSVKDESEYLTDICTCDHTPVFVSSRFGHIESAQMLLRLDKSAATRKDCDGASLIHIAACHGHHHFIRWIIDDFTDTNINSPSENGSTPLHSAAYCGQYKEMKLLISAGANAGALDNNNMTALHYIALNAGSMQVIPSLSCSGNDTKHSEIYFSNEHVTVWKQKKTNDFIYVYDVMSSCPLPNNCTFQELVYMDNNCRTLVELLHDLNHPFDINAKDSTGRTVLELAVINGLQCIIVEILNNISNTQARDMIRESSMDLILNKTHFETWFNLQFKKREREIAIILVLHVFDKCLLFHKAVFNQRPDWMHFLLQTGVNVRCSEDFFKKGVLVYLQSVKRSEEIEYFFLNHAVNVDIECQKPFLESQFHLLAYWPPSDPSNNFFYSTNVFDGYSEPGPLIKAMFKHPFGKQVLNHCRDSEGYTPLHRAAQGGNIIAIEHFLNLGADYTATTTDWNQTPLELAVSYAGLRYRVPSIDTESEVASNTSILLLKNTPNVKIICNGSANKLTIYHIAAYRGMVTFIRELFHNYIDYGLEVDCPDVNGITPLYLAKLNVFSQPANHSEKNPWLEIINLIESHGGRLRFPVSLETEHHVLYRHLYGNMPLKALEMKQDLLKDMELLLRDEANIDKCLKTNSRHGLEYNILRSLIAETAENKFCHRMTRLTKNFFKFFQSKKRDLRLASVRENGFKFTTSRLLLTAIPEGDYTIRDLKTLVYGTRYLVDLVMDKRTKYDYLRIMTLGRAQGTRLFHENEMDSLDYLELQAPSLSKSCLESMRNAIRIFSRKKAVITECSENCVQRKFEEVFRGVRFVEEKKTENP